MESRAVSIALQAAASGLIDFREARLLDIRWWVRYRLLTSAMLERNHRELLRASHLHHLSVIQISGLTVESFKEHQKSAQQRLNELIESYYPWQEKKSTHSEIKQLRDDWQRMWGDTQDPAVQARIKATADAILARAARKA